MCVGIFPAGGGYIRPLELLHDAGLQTELSSFNPQPQRNGPLPGFKSNSNQSTVDLSHQDILHTVICGSLLSERFFLGDIHFLKM